MGLSVIGAGFGRTGTMSLKFALERLGHGRCYHMADVYQTPEHVPLWQAALSGSVPDWNALFDGYQSCVHWPGCAFYRELMDHFSDAYVLLSLRDANDWYDSFTETLYRLHRQPVSHPQAWRALHQALIWDGVFGGRFEDRAHAMGVYERHNDTVREYVPCERLIVHKVGDGWGPLCAALGVDEPGTAFPHLNDRAAFDEIAKRLG